LPTISNGVGVAVSVGEGSKVLVRVGVCVGVWVKVGVWVRVTVGDAVGGYVGEAVPVGVDVADGVAVGVGEDVDVAVPTNAVTTNERLGLITHIRIKRTTTNTLPTMVQGRYFSYRNRHLLGIMAY
jgi:hypothetical protein